MVAVSLERDCCLWLVWVFGIGVGGVGVVGAVLIGDVCDGGWPARSWRGVWRHLGTPNIVARLLARKGSAARPRAGVRWLAAFVRLDKSCRCRWGGGGGVVDVSASCAFVCLPARGSAVRVVWHTRAGCRSRRRRLVPVGGGGGNKSVGLVRKFVWSVLAAARPKGASSASW
jgi:hypothetical protein